MPRKKRTAEQRQKLGKIQKEHWKRPEFRSRMLDIAKSRWTPELRQRMSKKTKVRLSSQKERERCRRNIIRMWESPAFRENISSLTSERLNNGELSRRCKWYDYLRADGTIVKVQGSFELRVAKALDQFGYNWDRNFKRIRYKGFDGVWHYYTPDFIISEGSSKFFVEVKGYLDCRDFLKLCALTTTLCSKLYVLFDDGIKELEAGKDPFTRDKELAEIVRSSAVALIDSKGQTFRMKKHVSH